MRGDLRVSPPKPHERHQPRHNAVPGQTHPAKVPSPQPPPGGAVQPLLLAHRPGPHHRAVLRRLEDGSVQEVQGHDRQVVRVQLISAGKINVASRMLAGNI